MAHIHARGSSRECTMRKRFSSAICAAALLLSGTSALVASAPAQAATFRIGFNFFHDRLARSGRWLYHPVFGRVWQPGPWVVGPRFQPYTNGYWEYTDEYGWYWVSEDRLDDVVYHYGRWVYDPQWRWLWIPGYTWAPAWVVWREGEDYSGWMPMPPDEAFISGEGPAFGVNIGPIGINFYRNWYHGRVDPANFWVFVNKGHIVDRDYRRYALPRDRVKVVIGRTRDVTRFEVVNNRVVNRGIEVKVVEGAAGRRIAPVSARAVIKPNAVITTVDESKQIRERERASNPVDVEKFKRGVTGKATPAELSVPAGGGKENANAPGGPNETPPGGKNNPAGATGPGSNAPTGAPEAGKKGGRGGETTGPGEATTPPTGNAPAGTPEAGGKKGNRGETANPNGPSGGPNATGPGQTSPAAGAPGEQNPTTGEAPRKKRNRPGEGTPGAGPGMSGPGE